MSNIKHGPWSAKKSGESSIASGDGGGYDGSMQTLDHELIDKKIQLVEERMDHRVQRIEDSVKGITQSLTEMKASIGNLKQTVVVTAIGAVLTTIFGVAAFNATLLSNMVSSFESGRNTATALATTTAEIAQTREQLKAIETRLGQAAQSAQTVPAAK